MISTTDGSKRRPAALLLAWSTLLVCLVGLPPAARSGSAGEPEDAAVVECDPVLDEAEQIVVTARRCGQPAFEVDRSLSVITTRDLLELQGQTLPDALQETTGVFVQRTNRGAGAPFLRGLVGPQNLILVDGVRFNNSTFRTGPNQYLAILDPTALSRVEVMLGPGSVLYGSDAMGGVIQVFPTRFFTQAGPHAKGGLRVASADGSGAAWVDAGYHDRAADLVVGGSLHHFGPLRAGGDALQPISAFEQGAWRARGRVALTDDMTLGVTYLAMRVRDAGRADRLYEGRFRFYDNDDDLAILDWRYHPGGVLKELRLAASVHRMRERVDRYRCDLPADPQAGDADGCLAAARVPTGRLPDAPLTRQELYSDTIWTPGLLADANLVFWDGRARVTAEAEAYWDTVASARRERRAGFDPAWSWSQSERGNFSDDSTYLSSGGSLHAEVDLYAVGDAVLAVSAGGRVSHFAAHAPDVPGLGDVDYANTGFVGTLGFKVLWLDRAMAYLNFSQGFRAPNLQETTVLGDTGSKFEVPNDALRPERSDTLELGLRLVWPKAEVGLSAFTSFLDDVIDERTLQPAEWAPLGLDPEAVGDKPVVQRVNGASGLYWGAEGRFSMGPWWNLRLWTRAAFVYGQVETRAGQTLPARRVPPMMGAAGLRYEPPGRGFYLEVFSRFAGRQDRLHPSDEADLRICEDPDHLGDTFADSGATCHGTPGWVTLNLRAGYSLSDRLRLDLAATNLTDQRYRYHGSGLDAPGLGASVSVFGTY